MVKRSIIFGVLVSLILLISGCNSGESGITVWQKIDEGALLVDVRSPAEFEQGHLEGALLIPHTQVASRLAEFGDDKSRPIVLYCKSGGRAGKAQKVLEENGFTNLTNGGGYQDLLASKPNS